jgi:hypothetical protein
MYVSRFNLPPHSSISTYALASLNSTRPIGHAKLTLSDTPAAAAGWSTGADVIANVLPLTGSRIGVRVGSCLPWHGYTGRSLYLAQVGGSRINRLSLSGVRDG